MAQKTDIFNEAWCDIVFEDRNKEYGAFELRKQSSKRHLMALISTVVLFTLALVAPTLLDKIIPEQEEAMVEVTSLSDLKLDEKKVEKPKEMFLEEPPPVLKSTIKFTPPIITNEPIDEEDLMKTQEVLTEAKTKISIIDNVGSEDPDAIDPTELDIIDEPDEVFMVVEQMPDFPGGTEALLKFIQSNLRYPQIAADNGITGRVYLSFVVNTDGSIVDIQVMRGISRECDAEAVRVIKSMPKWIPGRQNGTAVRVKYTVPIVYVLQ